MKKLLTIILATLVILTLVAGCAKSGEEIPVYSWEEAIDHIGETAKVTGPIINLWDPEFDGDFKLGMGKVWAQQGWVNIELKVDRDMISPDDYVGKTVSVRGEIYLYDLFGKQAPAIDVTDLSQIEIID
jgi:hypothetical protein